MTTEKEVEGEVIEEETALVEAKPEVLPSLIPGMEMHPLVQGVMDGRIKPGELDALLDIQAKHDAMMAEKAYNQALSEFQRLCPAIPKDSHVYYKKNDGSVVDYWHPSLGGLVKTVSPILGELELNLKWKTKQENGIIRVTCVLTHAMGYSEETPLEAAPDASGGKNSIQAVGSTISYLKRYTAESLLGLATEDDDGRSSEDTVEPETIPVISDEQYLNLNSLLENTGRSEVQVLEFLAKQHNPTIIGSLRELPSTRYNPMVAMLEGMAQ